MSAGLATTIHTAERDLLRRVQQFYYTEARLIDERHFEAWLDLFSDDIRYLAPIRRNRPDGEFSDSYAGICHFDDDKNTLIRRVKRMTSTAALTENPPSIQRHIISNVQIEPDTPDTITAHSNFQAYRYRLDTEVELFTGHRIDTMRYDEDRILITRRTIYLDFTTLLANNINLLL
jgi:biphenyl 2,3-dioxygenase beta subunit